MSRWITITITFSRYSLFYMPPSHFLVFSCPNWRKKKVCKFSLQPKDFTESWLVQECLFWDRHDQNFSQLISSCLLFMILSYLHIVLTDFRWASSKCSCISVLLAWFIIPFFTYTKFKRVFFKCIFIRLIFWCRKFKHHVQQTVSQAEVS